MNIPNIPDNFHKFLVLLGGLIILYGFYRNETNSKIEHTKIEHFENASDSISISILKEELRLEDIINKSNYLALENGLENPFIKNSDSTYTRIKYAGVNKISKQINDTVNKLLAKYEEEHQNLLIQNEKLKIIANKLNKNADFVSSQRKENKILYIFGFLLLLSGYTRWNSLQKIKDNLLKWEFIEKGEIFDHCQSCGKNFSAIRKFGNEIDGKTNYSFCSNCYKNGSFIYEKTDEYFLEIKTKALASTKNWIKKIKIKSRFSNLIRWKVNDY